MTPRSPHAALLDAIPTHEASALVDGGTTRYWVYGPDDAEETIVVVHGFRGDHHGLEPVVGRLFERLPAGRTLRVIAPDLPGFGGSDRLAHAEHSVASYASWLRSLRVEAGVSEDAIVLGHSFGSIVVGAAVAGGYPCSRVVLVNPIASPALAGPRGVLTRLAVLYYRLGAALPERAGFALLTNRAIVRVMSIAMAKTRDRGLRRWIHDQHDRYFSAFADRDVVLEAFRASVGSDVSEFASAIRQPTLLVAAERDDISTVEAQRRLSRLFPDARLEVIPAVGHLVHYEAPARAARLVADFLGLRPVSADG